MFLQRPGDSLPLLDRPFGFGRRRLPMLENTRW